MLKLNANTVNPIVNNVKMNKTLHKQPSLDRMDKNLKKKNPFLKNRPKISKHLQIFTLSGQTGFMPIPV